MHQYSSYFNFTPFSLITFLHSSQFTRLISAPLDSPELDFFGRSHRSFSYLFNTLFNVEPLTPNAEGYDLSLFQPQIPSTSVKPYLKHLEALGYSEKKFYPIKIQPREIIALPWDQNINIPFKFDGEMVKQRREILTYAFWILMASRNSKEFKEIWETLGLSNSNDSKAVLPETFAEYAVLFPNVRKELKNKFAPKLKLFRDSLYKNKSEMGCVD